MSASALFVPTTDQGSGSYYVPVTRRIAELPRDQQHSADLVWKALIELLRRGQSSATITDRLLQQTRWLRDFSLRFIQKGLKALESIGVIERIRGRGLRTIVILDRLRGRSRPEPRPRAEAAPAPAPARPTRARARGGGRDVPDTPDSSAAGLAPSAPAAGPALKAAVDEALRSNGWERRRPAARPPRATQPPAAGPPPAEPTSERRAIQERIRAYREAKGP
jgi:hypothetical protein